MRLPVTNPQRGVQSLGRRDIRAPMRVANAGLKAAQYEGQGLKNLGAAAQEVGLYMERRNDENAVHEFNTEYLKAQAEAERALGLVSNPTLSTQTPGMSGLDYKKTITVPTPDGGTEEVERTEVPNYEVGGQWLTSKLNDIRDASLNNMSSRRAKEKFAAQFGLLQAKVHSTASGTFRAQRTSDRKGGYALNKEKYLRSSDEEGAKALAFQAFASRTINGEELAEDILAIETRIDTDYYANKLGQADDQASLELVLDEIDEGYIVDGQTGEIRKARLTAAQLRTMRAHANTKLDEEDAATAVRHDEGKDVAVQNYLQGTLTLSALKQMHAADLIDNTTAMAMAARVRTQSKEGLTLKSQPGLVDSLTKQILNVRVVDPGETTTEDNFQMMQEQIRIAQSGLLPNGQPMPGKAPLTGADAQKLLTLLDQQRKRVYDTPDVQAAEDNLRAITKMPPRGSMSILEDTEETRRKQLSFNNAVNGLHDYMSRYGTLANPQQWVKDNADMFDPEVQALGNLQAFAESIPGAKLVPYLQKQEDPTMPHTAEQYKAAIGKAVALDGLDWEQARLYYDKLEGLDGDAVQTPGAKEALANEVRAAEVEEAKRVEGLWFYERWFDDPSKPTPVSKPGTGGDEM